MGGILWRRSVRGVASGSADTPQVGVGTADLEAGVPTADLTCGSSGLRGLEVFWQSGGNRQHPLRDLRPNDGPDQAQAIRSRRPLRWSIGPCWQNKESVALMQIDPTYTSVLEHINYADR